MSVLPLNLNHPTNKHDIVPLLFLNLVVQSAFIPETKTLSALFVARAGLGKTIKLEHLRKLKFVYYTVDITPKHLIQFFEKVNRGEKKFLVIPDYITTMGHAKKTKDLLRGHLRAMMEEGVKDSDAYGVEYHFDKILKAGIISAITPEYFEGSSRIWKADGFLSRLIPFSYSHSPETQEIVLTNIRDKINTIKDFEFEIKRKVHQPPTRNREIDLEIKNMALEMAEGNPPYRPYQQILALCNSSAVLRDSKTVEQNDIKLIRSMLTFVNRKQNPL